MDKSQNFRDSVKTNKMKIHQSFFALPICIFLFSLAGKAITTSGGDPVLMLKGQEKSKISVEHLRNDSVLEVRSINQDQSVWSILSFRFVIVPKKGDPYVVVNQSPVFSKELRTILDRAGRGDHIYFEDVVLVSQNSDTMRANLDLKVL